MKRIWLLLAATLISGCQDSDALTFGRVVVNSIFDKPEMIARERAAGVPYATLGLQLGGTPEVLFILGTQNAAELDWYAGEDAFIRTRNGRIIRTVGMPYDLGGVRELTTLNPTGPISEFLLDYPELGVFGAAATCTRRDAGAATVQILGADVATRHIVERCAVPAMKWNFNNEYWTDDRGFVWRSVQHIHPRSPAVNMEMLRPPQNPA